MESMNPCEPRFSSCIFCAYSLLILSQPLSSFKEELEMAFVGPPQGICASLLGMKLYDQLSSKVFLTSLIEFTTS